MWAWRPENEIDKIIKCVLKLDTNLRAKTLKKKCIFWNVFFWWLYIIICEGLVLLRQPVKCVIVPKLHFPPCFSSLRTKRKKYVWISFSGSSKEKMLMRKSNHHFEIYDPKDERKRIYYIVPFKTILNNREKMFESPHFKWRIYCYYSQKLFVNRKMSI